MELQKEKINNRIVLSKKQKRYLPFKRALDILFSVMIFLVLIIPMLLISLLVFFDSKGPVIFKQERLGKDGKPFIMYKFRTMGLDAEADGPRWASENDERCTKIGYILRQSRLDELPQLFNILKGDMSFVGPRPEREYFYNEFEKYIPNFRDRLFVIPGLTGHAQVNGGYDLGPEEKIVYDMEYIEKFSFLMDLRCVLETFTIVFNHKGAR